MKRILVWGLSNNRAGTERVIENYINAVDSKDYCFDFLCYEEPEAFSYLYRENENRVFVIPVKIQHPIKSTLAAKNFLREKASEYYAVWFNANDISNIDVLRYAKKYGIKHRILHSHNSDIPTNLITRIFTCFNFPKIKFLATERWACSSAAGRFMFGDDEFEVIPNPIDSSLFQYDPNARRTIRERYQLEDSFVIGTVGRLMAQKNQEFILNIMPHLLERNDSCKFVILGQGELENKLLKRAIDLGIGKEFMIIPPKSNVADYLSAFDCFVFPSVYEGLGLALIEAQFNGLPCVASDKVPREAIISKNAIRESLDNPNEWVDAILNASRDGAYIMQEKAYCYSKEKLEITASSLFEFDD